jgi:hypothetical protein
VPLVGGTPITLAAEQVSPSSLAVDAFSVYWTIGAERFSGGAVMKAPLGGGTATRLALAQDNPSSIVVDDTSVYWATSQAVMKLSPK